MVIKIIDESKNLRDQAIDFLKTTNYNGWNVEKLKNSNCHFRLTKGDKEVTIVFDLNKQSYQAIVPGKMIPDNAEWKEDHFELGDSKYYRPFYSSKETIKYRNKIGDLGKVYSSELVDILRRVENDNR